MREPNQPPSRGCELKPELAEAVLAGTLPAAFAWLRVETSAACMAASTLPPAAFAWLRVETDDNDAYLEGLIQPPSRGCELKQVDDVNQVDDVTSRLRVAAS